MANIVRLDICEGKPRSFVMAQDVENGLFLFIEGKADNAQLEAVDYEAYKVRLAKAGDDIGLVLFHKSVENMYDEKMARQDFVLKAGQVGRGYVPTRGDIVTIPVELMNDLAVGEKLALGADGKLVGAGASNAIAIVEAKEDIVIPGAEPQASAVIRFL